MVCRALVILNRHKIVTRISITIREEKTMFSWNHKDEGFKAIPDGVYKATITRLGTKDAKNGHKLLKANLRVHFINGETAPFVATFTNQENMLWLLRKFFKSMGKEYLFENDILDEMVVKESIGQEIWVKIENELYAGREYPKARDYLTPEEAKMFYSYEEEPALNDDIPL